MTTPQMSNRFSHEFRARLVEHVHDTVRPRRRRRTILGAGLAVAVVLGGTATAAATGLLALPGGTTVTELGTARSGTFVGSGGLQLGPRPALASGVALSFTCSTVGTFTFDDGSMVTCNTVRDLTEPTTYLLPIAAIHDDTVRVTASTDARWSLTAGYASTKVIDWSVNSSGQTYGVINDRGEPDLIAVVATNGKQGYVHRTDLDAADGTAAAQGFKTPEDAIRWQEQHASNSQRIPVYELDGSTRVGEFQIGG